MKLLDEAAYCPDVNRIQSSDSYTSKAIPVIGDALTTEEINKAHVAATGKPLPAVPNFLGSVLLAMNKHTKNLWVLFVLHDPPVNIRRLLGSRIWSASITAAMPFQNPLRC